MGCICSRGIEKKQKSNKIVNAGAGDKAKAKAKGGRKVRPPRGYGGAGGTTSSSKSGGNGKLFVLSSLTDDGGGKGAAQSFTKESKGAGNDKYDQMASGLAMSNMYAVTSGCVGCGGGCGG